MDNFTLEFTFKRYEERYAILGNDLTGEIKWPIVNLPEDVKPNDRVRLRLTCDSIEQQENLSNLKQILEELVN